jgi:hypothetical protein
MSCRFEYDDPNSRFPRNAARGCDVVQILRPGGNQRGLQDGLAVEAHYAQALVTKRATVPQDPSLVPEESAIM